MFLMIKLKIWYSQTIRTMYMAKTVAMGMVKVKMEKKENLPKILV